MIAPRAPVYLTHSPLPNVRHFAILAALEASIRGTMMSVLPLVIYRAFNSAEILSSIYLMAGIASLLWGVAVPWVTTKMPRRWTMTLGALFYLTGCTLILIGHPLTIATGIAVNNFGTVTISVCLNAYVLDYIERSNLGHNESTRMVYSAVPWAVGPILGVWLLNIWEPAPFLLSGTFALLFIAIFWKLRLGNGKQITKARGPAPNPVAFLGRFLSQPRLIAGWLFAVIRSCGWWVYVVYLPVFCIQNGLGETPGAIALSTTNALLLTTPLMLRLVRRWGVRASVVSSFALCGICFVGAFLFQSFPWGAFAMLAAGSVILVMLDVCGSLPFLMAVKPSERTEMAAVYASFRDASGILTPAAAWAVLLVSPVAGVFAVTGGAMLGVAWIARRLHPRLGEPRNSTTRSAETS